MKIEIKSKTETTLKWEDIQLGEWFLFSISGIYRKTKNDFTLHNCVSVEGELSWINAQDLKYGNISRIKQDFVIQVEKL
jgi:hypothetical protein